MNAPNWVFEPAINKKVIAEYLGMRPDLFSRKLNGKPLARSKVSQSFTENELSEIEEYRKLLIEKLR